MDSIALLAEPATLRRVDGPGEYEDGAFIPSTSTSITIEAAFQPSVKRSNTGAGENRIEYPEGARLEEKWMIWAETELLVDDVIVRTATGKTYRINSVFPWPRGDFWEAIATLDFDPSPEPA